MPKNTKKFKLLNWEKSENKIKAEHHKKFKFLCLRNCILKNEKEKSTVSMSQKSNHKKLDHKRLGQKRRKNR